MQDQIIVELIRSGKSDKALNSLYKYFPLIRKHIRNFGGTRQDAEDIFQEGLIILCRKAKDPSFTLIAQLSTYLYSVCRYLWKDETGRRLQTTDSLPDIGVGDEELWQAAIDEETHARLAEKVLNGLGDRCRELLLLFYKSQLRLKDIAQRMGYSSENTAKNQKYKCLETARTQLREQKPTFETL